jgi:uncharacterized membrane protein HdeD (DUF308 family)
MTSTAANDSAAAGSSASPFPPCAMSRVLIANWWLLALRGLLGVIFGVVALAFPGSTILALVLLFSAYALVDGAFSVVAAIRAARQGQQWGLLTLQGVASIAAGVIAFLWPAITVLAFVLLIAAWSIVSGVLFVTAAFRVDDNHERWWLAIGGIAEDAAGCAAGADTGPDRRGVERKFSGQRSPELDGNNRHRRAAAKGRRGDRVISTMAAPPWMLPTQHPNCTKSDITRSYFLHCKANTARV